MITQSTMIAQKRKPGPPATGKGHLLGVRLSPQEIAQLDEWIARQDEPGLTRPEAMRRLTGRALANERR